MCGVIGGSRCVFDFHNIQTHDAKQSCAKLLLSDRLIVLIKNGAFLLSCLKEA